MNTEVKEELDVRILQVILDVGAVNGEVKKLYNEFGIVRSTYHYLKKQAVQSILYGIKIIIPLKSR